MRNVRLLYAINFLIGFVLWYAIEKLYMVSIGLSAVDIGINAAVLYATVLIVDIPSGLLADRWSRKYTILLSTLMLIASTYIFSISTTLPMYLIGSVIFGLYWALSSGTYEATMYDSLVEHHRQRAYDKHQGRARGLFFIGIAASSILSGYIVNLVGLRETFVLSLIAPFLTLVPILLIHEPTHYKHEIDTRLALHIKRALRLIRAQPVITQLAIFFIFEGLLHNTQGELGGLYYIGLGLSAVAMSWLGAGKWAADALGQFLAPYIGQQRAWILLPLGFVSYFLISVIPGWGGVVAFLVAAFLFSVAFNQAQATAQHITPSHIRATTLSLFNFGTNFLFIPLSFVFGCLTQAYSVFAAIGAFSIFGLLYVLYWFAYGRRVVTTS